MDTPLLWWGYLHVNGTIHPKRYFDKRDIEDAEESDLVEAVYGPFEAESREEALENLKAIFTEID